MGEYIKKHFACEKLPQLKPCAQTSSSSIASRGDTNTINHLNPAICLTHLLILSDPFFDDFQNFINGHNRKSHIRPRMKAHYSTITEIALKFIIIKRSYSGKPRLI